MGAIAFRRAGIAPMGRSYKERWGGIGGASRRMGAQRNPSRGACTMHRSIDATQRRLFIWIAVATLLAWAITIAIQARGGRPDPPQLRGDHDRTEQQRRDQGSERAGEPEVAAAEEVLGERGVELDAVGARIERRLDLVVGGVREADEHELAGERQRLASEDIRGRYARDRRLARKVERQARARPEGSPRAARRGRGRRRALRP